MAKLRLAENELAKEVNFPHFELYREDDEMRDTGGE
jgi:hypothetical protein